MSKEIIKVPDIGGAEGVEVVEICVAVGDTVEKEESLVVLESDKASMEVPSPMAGKVIAITISDGDSLSEGDVILELETAAEAAPEPVAEEPVEETVEEPVAAPEPEPVTAAAPAKVETPKAVEAPTPVIAEPAKATPTEKPSSGGHIYAGPAVRRLAREMGVELDQVKGSGPKNRISKDDLKAYVKTALTEKPASGSAGIPAIPEVDFSKFGEITVEPLTKIHKMTAHNMQRNWLNIPHVTQFDDADITNLEDFRQSLKAEAEKRGVKITPLPFLLKACAAALRDNPKFNASLSADGESMVYKHFINIGMAVDTPAGLVVPVIKDVDRKSIWDLAAETVELATRAKDRQLKPVEMQGGCFTISSLGGIGGQGFTPIVNAPEVAILGVSKLATKPVWDGNEFMPRKMLPLSLSYDHRAINGGDAGRFFTYLTAVLGDIRRLAL